jgi:hypothetical protein
MKVLGGSKISLYNRSAFFMLKRSIITGLLSVVTGWAQHSPVATAQLAVNVSAEATLAWQGSSVVLVKARLAPGTQARVWAADTCGAPVAGSQMISTSGTVAIDLASINGVGQPMVCLASSDGRVSVSLAALHN